MRAEAVVLVVVSALLLCCGTPEPPAAPPPSPGPPAERLEEIEPAPAEPPQLPVWHDLKRDESLYGLSKTYYGTGKHFRAILEANPRLDPRRMEVGRRILIPRLSDRRPKTAEPVFRCEMRRGRLGAPSARAAGDNGFGIPGAGVE